MNRIIQINIFIRLAILVLITMVLGWSIFTHQHINIIVIIAILVIVVVSNLLRYQYRVNDRISYFFESIRNQDYTINLPKPKGDKVLQHLYSNMERINQQIQQVSIDSVRQEQYFGALIEHVATGILSYDSNGFVIHANSSFKKLLGMKQFTHLKQLGKVDSKLANAIWHLQPHDQKLISFSTKRGGVTLLVKASPFKSQSQHLTLLSVQDINQELDERELDSWLKLIRVLTHEIMNSIAPVTSLSENLGSYFVREGEPIAADQVTDKMIQTTIRGLRVIQEQGQGLIRFVESYRSLTRLPKPNRKMMFVQEFLEKTVILSKADMLAPDVEIKVEVQDPSIQVMADEKQISQVLLNLIKNSGEAIDGVDNPKICLSCGMNEKEQVFISVADNGQGIPPNLIDEIFVPFFTTRENGSGIGLSISRQIMRLHGGSLRVRSIPEVETVFTMLF